MPGVEVPTCDAYNLEADAGGSGVHGHPELHSKFEASVNYMRPCPQNKNSPIRSFKQ